jgi:U4/U6.U5 tri-snRNP-associated protein 1
MSKEISLSIEETNALRAKLGIPLLKDPSLETGSEAKEVENLRQHALSKEKANKRKELISKIKEQKELGRSSTSASTTAASKGLGESGKGHDTTMEWALSLAEKARKKAKKVKLANEIVAQYDEKELEGIKVSHNVQDLDYETILVLKDRKIGGSSLAPVTLYR